MTTAGSGYTFGTVDVSLIPNIGSGTLASLDVVIPPNGGHGSDAARELGSYRLMFSTKLETTNAFVDFPSDLTYRRIGLVLNPFDFNTTTVANQNTRSSARAIKFPQSGAGTPSGNFAPGDIITQANTNAKDLLFHTIRQQKHLSMYKTLLMASIRVTSLSFLVLMKLHQTLTSLQPQIPLSVQAQFQYHRSPLVFLFTN